MREGSLDAPIRHPIDWNDPDFVDLNKLDDEMRRQFDVCHTCRRCFNLCSTFPRLFDLIDDQPDELDGVDSANFESVVESCTLCDMCFLSKCPYVPPHEFNIDFPHLMFRYRVAMKSLGRTKFFDNQIIETDRNGKLLSYIPVVINWISSRSNKLFRLLIEKVAGIHRDVELPKFHSKEFISLENNFTVNKEAPAYGREAIVLSTCFVNYNSPEIGIAALKVLAHNGINVEILYSGCCGMPQFEQGDVARVVSSAKTTVSLLNNHIKNKKDIISLTPSCALMMKSEWPLLLPNDNDIKNLSSAVFDLSEYLISISDAEGLVRDMQPIAQPVSLHVACHARAQNIGLKSADLLKLIPGIELKVVERCSGHGGSWGVKKNNFVAASKYAKGTINKLVKESPSYVCSECPLACKHLAQGIQSEKDYDLLDKPPQHPIQILADAYGI